MTILVTAEANRSAMDLGATPLLLGKIFSTQVVLAALLGKQGTLWLSQFLSAHPQLLAVASVLAVGLGICVFIAAARHGPPALRSFLLFSALAAAAALISPMASLTQPQWEVMAIPGNATRYWLFPILAFFLSLVWCVARGGNFPRLVATAALCLSVIGFMADVRLPAWPDLDFDAQAAAFAELPTGEHYVFRILPAPWGMELIKK